MRIDRTLAALAACLAAALATGCASGRTAKNPPPRPGASRGAAPDAAASATPEAAQPAPEAAQPAPEGAPPAAEGAQPAAEGAPPAPETPSEPAPGPGQEASGAPAQEPSPAPMTPGEPSRSGSFDDFMRRTGRTIEETKFLGTRLRPRMSIEVGVTDNVYYQDDGEVLVVDNDPDGNGILAFQADGVDNDGDGVTDEAGESIVPPRGEVDEIFVNANLGVGFELALNSALLNAINRAGNTMEIANIDLTLVEYFKESDSPDAFNSNVGFDIPFLLRINKDFNRNTFYSRIEGDYSNITDPLDVAVYQFDALDSTPAVEERSDFERTEWFAKGTLGWKGPVLDAKVSGRIYEMTLDDEDLQSADHTETELYGELGLTIRNTEHRVFAFIEVTDYDFDDRGPGGDAPGLRNFTKTRAGGGWEGPAISKKVRARLEGYSISQDIEDDDVGPFPKDQFGNDREFDSYDGIGGLARITYRPFITKPTEFAIEYSKDLEWSVVAEHKIVDYGNASFTHPINDRLSTQIQYSLTHENVSHRESRVYHEAGLRLNYRIAAFTEVYLQYTLRKMASSDEPITIFSDDVNERYAVQADGDFLANIASVGISVRF